MDVKLIVVGGKHNGQAIPVRGPKFFIGRAEDCHLRPNSDLISRHHCAILLEDDLLSVRDFGSKNGTLVNGKPIYGEEDLEDGSLLTVGPLTFRVAVSTSVSSSSDAKQPKVKAVEEPAQPSVPSTAKNAKKPAGEDDLDITGWLAADNDEVAPSTRTQTNILDKETLAQMLAEPSRDTNVDRPAREAAAKKEEKDSKKDGPKDKKTPARPNLMKKAKTPDSQSAAEDTLRQFFHRR